MSRSYDRNHTKVCVLDELVKTFHPSPRRGLFFWRYVSGRGLVWTVQSWQGRRLIVRHVACEGEASKKPFVKRPESPFG